ncbi:TPA: hypothetical protein DEA20_02445 [Candidatus Dependentiae bacterium]|nr:hypothetical protein [Candidatus Dependentiae bacterium]
MNNQIKSFLLILAGIFVIFFFAADLVLKLIALILGIILILIGISINNSNNFTSFHSYKFVNFKNIFKK